MALADLRIRFTSPIYDAGTKGAGHSTTVPGTVGSGWTVKVDETAKKERNRNDMCARSSGEFRDRARAYGSANLETGKITGRIGMLA